MYIYRHVCMYMYIYIYMHTHIYGYCYIISQILSMCRSQVHLICELVRIHRSKPSTKPWTTPTMASHRTEAAWVGKT